MLVQSLILTKSWYEVLVPRDLFKFTENLCFNRYSDVFNNFKNISVDIVIYLFSTNQHTLGFSNNHSILSERQVKILPCILNLNYELSKDWGVSFYGLDSCWQDWSSSGLLFNVNESRVVFRFIGLNLTTSTHLRYRVNSVTFGVDAFSGSTT